MSRTRHARPRKRPPMCKHHRPSTVKGMAGHDEAKGCAQRGEWQQQCPDCLQFFWPFEMGEKPVIVAAVRFEDALSAALNDGRTHTLNTISDGTADALYLDGKLFGVKPKPIDVMQALKNCLEGEKLPTHAEEWAEYDRRKAAFDVAYQSWKAGGRVGPPPPYPVRPHTPGPG